MCVQVLEDLPPGSYVLAAPAAQGPSSSRGAPMLTLHVIEPLPVSAPVSKGGLLAKGPARWVGGCDQQGWELGLG